MNITLDSVVWRNNALLTSEVDHELVMLSVDNGAYYGTNRAGRHVWHLLGQPTTARQLCSALTQQFNVEANTCAADVLPFLQEMANQHLIFVQAP